MPRPCSVCARPDHPAVDRALVAGEPFRRIAARFGLSEQAVRRHRAEHLPETLALAAGAAEAARAADLLLELQALRAKAYGLLLKAEAAGDLRTALAGVREARACLELLAELEAEPDRRPAPLLAPEWLAVRAAVLDALAAHPAARAAVAERLLALGAGA